MSSFLDAAITAAASVVVASIAAVAARINARDPFARVRSALELREKMPEECRVVWDVFLQEQVVKATLDRTEARSGLAIAAFGFPLVLFAQPLTGPLRIWLSIVGWFLYVLGLVYWAIASQHVKKRDVVSHASVNKLRHVDEITQRVMQHLTEEGLLRVERLPARLPTVQPDPN